MKPEPSLSELLQRIAELEAQLAAFETANCSTDFAREIAERERAMRDREERLRFFIENVPAAVAMFDREMRYIAVSDRWRTEYLGGKECVGLNHYEVFPECPERWRDAHRKGIAGETVRVNEDVWKRADGTEAWAGYEVRPWRTVGGESGGILILIEDITERKRAEAAVRESEERLTRAEFLANVGNWSADLTTNRLVWSKGVFRIFGKSDEFVPSFEGWLAAALPPDVDRVRQWCVRCLTEKRAYPIEFQITSSDGDVRTLVSTSEITLGDQGLPVRIFGAVQDITDIRRTQQELFASQKLESIGTLASGIAHDFNNLLGSILLQAESALSELEAGAAPVQELNVIRATATRGAEIVQQLMIYAGKESAAMGLVDVSRTVSEMLELLRFSVSKHVALEADLSQDLPPIRGRTAQLRQLVMNLVTNAADAMREREGFIHVVARRIRWDKVDSENLSQGDFIQLEVSDTGCGMPREVQARMYDPFFTTKSGGHGLGLAVVHGIVRSLDGSIDVTSEPGRGTSFVITLPCAEAEGAPLDHTPPRRDDVTPACENATLLVVEDEDSLREAVVKLLHKQGFEVLEAADGSAAIEVLRGTSRPIDLVLLDVTIPGRSSHDVVREMEKTNPSSKVLLTSAYDDEFVKQAMSGQQILGFIRKPFHFDNLLHSIRTALSS